MKRTVTRMLALFIAMITTFTLMMSYFVINVNAEMVYDKRNKKWVDTEKIDFEKWEWDSEEETFVRGLPPENWSNFWFSKSFDII